MAQANDVQTATEPRRENGETHRHEHDHELRELAARENIGQDLERIRDRIELTLHLSQPGQRARTVGSGSIDQANQQAQQSEGQAARTFDLADEADQLAQHARHLQRVV